MAVFRVEKTNNFTIMSNYHFKDKRLSLKAKGLLSTMLSLPESWDYTLAGLEKICREGITAIRSAVAELEKCGSLERERIRNASGQYEDIEYIIREKPLSDEPLYGEPAQEKPTSENPTAASRISENRIQLRTDDINNPDYKEKKKLNTEGINDLSINRGENGGFTPETDSTDKIDIPQLEEKIKEDIEYDCLCERYEQTRVDEIVCIMLEMLGSSKGTIHVAGEEFPAGFVKGRLAKIGAENIIYVFECMSKNPSRVRNIKSYLRTALFNSVSTIDAYYAAEVNHDLYGQKK
jgi:hypothetical protein